MNINIIKVLIASFLLALSTTSCLQLSEDQDSGYGYLSMSELSAEVEVYEHVPTKTGTTTLKDLGVTEFNQPDIDNVTFTLTAASFSKTWEGALTESLKLPVGTYNLKAQYDNTGNDGFGEALYGEVNSVIEISPVSENKLDLKFPLANALLMVDVSEDLKTDFNPDVVNFKDKSTKENLFSAGLGVYNFIPADREMDVVVSGVNSAGVSADLVYNLPSMSAKYAKHIAFGKSDDWPEILWDKETNLNDGAFEGSLYFHPVTITNMSVANMAELTYQIKGGEFSDWTKVENISDVKIGDETYKLISGLNNGTTYSLKASVGNIQSVEISFKPVTLLDCIKIEESSKAEHTYSNSELYGSKVTANFSLSLPSIIKKLVNNVTVSGSFADGKRSFSGKSFDENGKLSVVMDEDNNESWPYLPQGLYDVKLSSSCKLSEAEDDRTITNELSPKGSINVPAPTISVDVSAYTTYDWYLASNLKNANNYDKRLLVEGRKAILKISDSILRKTNYAYLLTESYVKYSGSSLATFLISDSESNTNTISYDDVTYTDSQLGSYLFEAKVVFDGVEATDKHDCHITGLPYSYNFVDGSLDKFKNEGWSLNGSLRVSNESLTGRAKALVLQHQRLSSSGEKGYVVSPQFRVPLNKTISVQPKIHRSSYCSSGQLTRIGYVGAVSNTSTSNTTSISYETKGGNGTSGTIIGNGDNDWMSSFEISYASSYISVDCKALNEYKTGAYYFLHEVHFRYAE